MSAISIPVGQSTVVVNALTADGNGFTFSLQPTGYGKAIDVVFAAIGTFSAATGAVFASPDGGTTWIDAAESVDFTAPYGVIGNSLFPGILYRLQFAGFSGTSITVYCARN